MPIKTSTKAAKSFDFTSVRTVRVTCGRCNETHEIVVNETTDYGDAADILYNLGWRCISHPDESTAQLCESCAEILEDKLHEMEKTRMYVVTAPKAE